MSILFSCSGDDPDVNPDPAEPEEPTVVTGIFVDSEVAGLQYSTETQSGVTNSEGEYNYIDGETVTFSVGEITLGSAPAGPEMSPVSIASTSNASIETEEVKNIAAFLQTLDADNDPSNGILIETATVEAISISSIDFTQPIIKILGEIVAEVNLANETNLSVVYPETAAEHLAGTLGEPYQADDPIFGEFIPYLENQYGYARKSYYWVHETDEEGRLVKSYQHEKYPMGLYYEIFYNDFNEEGQPVLLEMVTYDKLGQERNRATTEIFYSENGSVERSIKSMYTPQGDLRMYQTWYTQFDDEKRVLEYEAAFTPDSDPTTRVVLVYDEEGNRVEYLGYNLETGELTNRILYTYTEWGDIASETRLDASGNETSLIEYFYRMDGRRTLEKVIYTAPSGSQTTHYNEIEIQTNQ